MTGGSDSPELTVLHRIPSGSNAVYRCHDEVGAEWVYKPSAGERPLVDFPDGTLAAREIATYVVSEALGWGLVPETVEAFGPGGVGMAQRWIVESSEEHLHDPVDVHPVGTVPPGRAPVLRGEGADGQEVVVAHELDARIRRIALLDLVVNNADRKGGHLLRDTSGAIWAIDHGLSFHVEPKLRTVLWGWSGTSVPEEDRVSLTRVSRELGEGSLLRSRLAALLSPVEVTALAARVDGLVASGSFPAPGPGYPLPWPLF